MSFNIFIDTEFTDFLDPQLISIGLVTQSGEEFYAELPYEVRECSEFVKAAVLPLLGYAPHAEMTKDDLYVQMTNWLKLVRPKDQEVFICYDYQTDWDLFYDALDGRVPPWCKRRLVADRINELLRYEYHQKNSLPEHHALNDARANCYAFREPAQPISESTK
ncbi:3'-5' exoribonuclease [Herbaspirillum huttiense]|uniref:3'-5' exoribonuclease n=1 Tax=Herbaspirillum huttiense subsp. lycopersici TaxID=3074428 RepID=A0ABU2EW38_9BURK|nr:3'-5' exoribonuclease [Herbaspirillum huttiense]MDR9851932.1 3'-5' exoribonuclease [Herbaspirillum huttiense SE1]